MVRLLSILLLLVAGTTTSQAEDFYYKDYNVDVQVHKDNSYSVTETMLAHFTAPRHGIVREWNTNAYVKRRLKGDDGEVVERLMTYQPSFKNFKVSENYEMFTEEGLALRIGDANTLVEGDHVYEISYDYCVGDDRTTVDDIFFFSLLGADNETDTQHFTFSIRFDKPLPKESLKDIRLYCGAWGNEENSAQKTLTLVTDTLIKGEVAGLRAYEAVSIFVGLPQGYYEDAPVDTASTLNSLWYFLAVSAVLLILIMIRETKRRNNFTKVVECWPPKGLSSADLGYIYDTTVDPCDVISLIPYFANKGLLTIDTTSGHPVLTKKNDIDEKSPAYQRKFFNAMFSDGDTFDTKKPSSGFAACWLDMDGAVKKENKGIQNEYAWTYILMFLVAGISALAGLFACDITNRDALGTYGLVVGFGFLYVGFTSLFIWDKTERSRLKRGILIATWIAAFITQLMLLNEAANSQSVYLLRPMRVGIIIVYLMFIFASLFMAKLSNMSKRRLEYIGQILGLKEFIEKSEKPMLDRLLKEDEHYFYDILPYAVAFGLSEKWAKQFEGLDVKPADWYRGNDISTYALCHQMNTNNLYTRSMAQSVRHLSESRARVAASSHSSGGFSGGGFGGGGSHSW